MTIKESVSLAKYTTLRTGGPARFFAEVSTDDELQEALAFAKEKAVPYFILGGGSNILMSDDGFPGLVIKMNMLGMDFNDRGDTVEAIAGAGENWDAFVAKTVEQGLSGLENLSFIPGTVGAAPVQNIGAYGAEAKDTLAWVEAFDPKTEEYVTISNSECEFAYRDSIFKKPEHKHLVIMRVAFKLSKNKKPNASYKDLEVYFEEKGITEPSIQEVRNAVIEIRTRKLPSIDDFGTAGSFFKNPIIAKDLYEDLALRYPGLPSFPVSDEFVKIPLAWVLDNVCGVKGIRKGAVGVYKNQALVLVNYGGATSREVKALADELIALVKEKIGIVVSPEVEYVGAF